MASIKPVLLRSPHMVDLEIWKWIGLAAGDEAEPVQCTYKQDKTVGWRAATVGSSVLTLQATLEPEMPLDEYGVLHDSRGFANPMVLTLTTVLQLAQVLETVYAIKPVLTGGAGTSGVNVTLHMKGR